jgi:hypothetical protein
MHVTLSSAVGIQTPGKCLSLLHAGELCAFLQTIKCDDFLYAQDLLYILDDAWCICSDRCYIRKSGVMNLAITHR